MLRPGSRMPAAPQPAHTLPATLRTREEFAAALTALRERAGLSVREVARASDVPLGTVSGWFTGRHVPPPSAREQLLALLRACGVRDEELLAGWVAAAARVRRAPGRRAADAPAPYRGLAGYQAEDADWFVGREALTETLVALATTDGPGPRPRGLPVVVIGPSGSGKSSLLRAGLVPALSPTHRVTVCSPGRHPLATLQGALERLAATEDDQRLAAAEDDQRLAATEDDQRLAATKDVERPTGADGGSVARRPALLVVDQLEEIFTLAAEDGRRQALDLLAAVAAGTPPDGGDRGREPAAAPVRVVLGVRSDFSSHCMRDPLLARSLQAAQLVVPPMDEAELRRAVVEPARRAGVSVEDGLVDLLLRDLRPSRAGAGTPADASALPLFSHALLATWEHAQGGVLRVADYQAVGGVAGAVARTAEETLAPLDPAGVELARRLLLRLVRLVDGEPVARRRQLLTELLPAGPDQGAGAPDHDPATDPAADVVERFVAARLLSSDEDGVALAHEALLWAWPRLARWIEEGAEDLRRSRRLADAAAAWAEAGHDASALPRGAVLEATLAWAGPEPRTHLPALERGFLAAAQARAAAEHAASLRGSRRLRRLAGALAVLLVATTGLTVLSFRQTRVAGHQRDLAVSRQVAAATGRLRRTDLESARQLSLAAVAASDTREARSAVLSLSALPAITRLVGSSAPLQAVSVSADGSRAVVAGAQGYLAVWDLSVVHGAEGMPRQLATVDGGGGTLYAAALSPDGRTLVAGGSAGSGGVWDLSDPAHPTPTPSAAVAPAAASAEDATTYALAFSPDGRTLARATSTGRLQIFAAARPAAAPVATPDVDSPLHALAFSPDGSLLAAGAEDGTVVLWDVAERRETGRTSVHALAYSLAFAPDGRLLAVGSEDKQVHLLDVADPTRPRPDGEPLEGATGWVNAVAFSPDGRTLAGGESSGNAVLLWQLPDRRVLAALPHPAAVTGLAYRPDGTLLAVGNDGAPRLWRLPGPLVGTLGGGVFSVAAGPAGSGAEGTVLAAAADGARLWTAGAQGVSGPPVLLAPPAGSERASGTSALTRDGRALALGGADGSVYLWRLRPDPARPSRLVPASAAPVVLHGPTDLVESVAFSPDGSVLAAGGNDHEVWLWDVADPAAPRLLGHVVGADNYVETLAFTPDGRVLAVGSADTRVRLLDLTDPTRPRRIGPVLSGPSSYVDGVAVSPDGHWLAVGSDDRTVRIADISDPATAHWVGEPLTGPESLVFAVAWSPDGSMLAAATGDGTAWVWDMAGGRPTRDRAVLTEADGSLYSVAFTPDGRGLLTGGADFRVRRWSLEVADVARSVCTLRGGPLRAAEWDRAVPDVPHRDPCRDVATGASADRAADAASSDAR